MLCRCAFLRLPLLLHFSILLKLLGGVLAHKDWSNSAYPDIRGPASQLLMCASRIPDEGLLYVCDPDRIFNATQLLRINTELERLAIGTPCPCQRRSQCSSGSPESGNPFHGFVVSVALVDNLQMVVHSPSEQQLIDRAESFCKTLEGRWALGDCGNSVIVFVWRHYQKLIIWPARLAERYVTPNERKDILTRVNDLIQSDRWTEALSQVIYEIHQELKGDPERVLDMGTLSLIWAVGVASFLTILITLCVCAFRCCGNISPNEKFPERRAARFENSIMDDGGGAGQRLGAEYGSQLQRSLCRSPRTAHISPNLNLHHPHSNAVGTPISTAAAGVDRTGANLASLNFMALSDTTVV